MSIMLNQYLCIQTSKTIINLGIKRKKKKGGKGDEVKEILNEK